MNLHARHAPMLPVTIALVAGIVLAAWRTAPVWIAAAGVAICAATAAAALRAGRKAAAGAAILTAAMFLGAALWGLQSSGSSLPAEYRTYRIDILSDARMAVGARSRQTDAHVAAMRDDDGRWRRTGSRLRIYADTSLRLAAGERLVCRVRVRPFGDNGYGRMMRRRGYGGTIWLGRNNILQSDGEYSAALVSALHRRAVSKIESLPLRPENMAVALAVGTGESRMPGRELRTEYSRAGTAHLLALSGLHVGIIYLLVNLLLGWLPLLRHGNIIRCTAAIALLWLYVLSTGMPPSAIRAALMFSILQAARAASADYSAMNALACAAFVTLCFDTGLLFDAGFRLSYIAVAALILFGAPLCRRLRISCDRHSRPAARLSASVANFAIDTIVTGFVATAATAPLVSHLFGIIPLAGIATGPAAIAVAAVTVLLTALWVVLPLGFAAPAFAHTIDLSAGALNSLSAWIASHDWAAVEFRLTAAQTAAVYLIATVTIILIMRIAGAIRNPKNRPVK